MLRVLLPPTFKPVLQHIKVAGSCVNTDFWLDKITPEFTSYTGVTSLAAKQVCHVAIRSTVPLCHLWPLVSPMSPVASVDRVSPVGPLFYVAPLPLFPLVAPVSPCAPCGPYGPCVRCVPCVPVSSVSLVSPLAPVPLERGTLAKSAKTKYKFSEWPPNHQKPERGFEKFCINSCTSLIATELDLSEEITGK